MHLQISVILFLIGINLTNARADLSDTVDFDAGDLPKMHDTYDKNQARFFRDFKGRVFGATMPLHGVRESIFSKGTYDITLGKGFVGEVECNISDKRTIDFMTDLDKGDQLEVVGTIDDHVIGVVHLIHCKFSRP